MPKEIAPGLPADWLNGWLAAVGVTVLLPDVRLAWTADAVPVASFSLPEGRSVSERISDVLGDPTWRSQLAIKGVPRKITREEFRGVAVRARLSDGAALGCDHSLSASVTDLVRDSKSNDGAQLSHSPFDPAAPGTTGAVFDRLSACLSKLEQIREEMTALLRGCFEGNGVRVQANGLGFDPRRLVSGVQAKGEVFVDPVVEVLCFFGLMLFPIRGNGSRVDPRGWAGPASRRGSFTWPVWAPNLDVWGIDALLDRVYYGERQRLQRWGVRGIFRSVPYRQLDRSDPTRAYASEPLRWP
jgi:hypothetical protein